MNLELQCPYIRKSKFGREIIKIKIKKIKKKIIYIKNKIKTKKFKTGTL